MIRFFWKFKTQKDNRWRYKDFQYLFEYSRYFEPLKLYIAEQYIDFNCQDSIVNPKLISPGYLILRKLLCQNL